MSAQRAVRLDGQALVTGKAQFGTDVSIPGMLHGKLVRSSYAHAKIRSIDVSKAASLPGVKAVITAADVPDKRFWPPILDQSLFARDKVRYVGEPIAAVAAEDEATAEEAAALVEVEYEPLPVITTIDEALKSDILIHEEKSPYAPDESLGMRNVCSYSMLKRGDVEAGMREADLVVQDEFEGGMVSQLYLEPHAAVAKVEPGPFITVWTSTQSPYNIRSDIAQLLDLPASRIRVIGTKTGGGFGAKLRAIIEPYCIVLAMKTGRPVKMVYSRMEEMLGGTPQTPLRIQLKTGVKKDGTLLARYIKVLMDVGAYAGDGPVDVNIALLIAAGTYKVEHVYAEGYAVYTNKQRCGAFRSVSAPQATFALESHMEHIAEELGMDPLELRMKNVWDDGYTAPWGQRLENVGLRETLRRVAETIGWGAKLGKNQGIGIACGITLTAAMHPSSATVKINEDGSVTVIVGAADSGTGAMYAGLPLIVSRELGVPLEKITLVPSDTEASPYNDGAQGSSTTYCAGNAVMAAARQARQKLLEAAAKLLEARPEDLEIRDNAVYVKGSVDKALTIAEVVEKTHYAGEEIEGRGSYVTSFPPYDSSSISGFFYVPSLIDPTYTAHAALVEVDEDTGSVRILRYVAGQNSGKVLNVDGLAGQITGGVAQGIGFALYEEMKVNEEGVMLNPTLMDYLIPSAVEVPKIDIVLVEDFTGSGPYGAKGAGEAPIVPPPAAIANAIYHATGFRARRIPITSEDVFNGLRGR